MAIKTFSVGEVLTASDTNTYLANSGLVYVTSTTVGTASTLTIANAFSSTYTNYRIVFDNLKVGSGTIFVTTQLRVSGSTSATGYYDSRLEVNLAGTVSGAGSTNVAGWTTGIVGDATNAAGAYIDLFGPNLAAITSFSGSGIDARTTGSPYRAAGGFHNVATAYTDIVFTASTNFSTGTVTVYGYRKA